MEFVSYASSSKGNLYSVYDGETALLIEAGLMPEQINRRLDYQLDTISAVLISHEHMDHARGVKGLMRLGMDVYCSAGTAAALDIDGHHRVNIMEHGEIVTIGSYKVSAMSVNHDAAEPMCFIINSTVSNKSLFFAIDTGYVQYAVRGCNIYCIEANYSDELIGDMPRAWQDRLVGSHMSIEGVLHLLKQTDLSSIEEIHLMHLSGAHSDSDRFINKVQAQTGKPVYVCPE